MSDVIENWLPVVGYEGLYSVSDQGRVKSHSKLLNSNNGLKRRTKERILKAQDKGRGYRHVLLYKNKKVKNSSLHSLVLCAFNGSKPDGCEASHINGDKTNNNILNLCWENHSDNMKRKVGHGTNNAGEDNVTSKLTEKEVLQIRHIYSWGVKTQSELAKRFKISQSNISDVVTRKIWSHI